MVVHVHYCFPGVFIYFSLLLWYQYSQPQPNLGGGIAPLVVCGRNTSLKNKNTTFFFFYYFFYCSVLGALTSLLHLCHHPTQLFVAAAGPHDNPTRRQSPPPPPGPRPGPAGHTLRSSDNSTCLELYSPRSRETGQEPSRRPGPLPGDGTILPSRECAEGAAGEGAEDVPLQPPNERCEGRGATPKWGAAARSPSLGG